MPTYKDYPEQGKVFCFIDQVAIDMNKRRQEGVKLRPILHGCANYNGEILSIGLWKKTKENKFDYFFGTIQPIVDLSGSTVKKKTKNEYFVEQLQLSIDKLNYQETNELKSREKYGRLKALKEVLEMFNKSQSRETWI